VCFDHDSRPPIAPIAGGALDSEHLVLTADDGNRLRGFRARAAEPTGAGILVLPDVRGLHTFYEELALRFAENGIDALAIDYFGRTTEPDSPRDESFEYMPHVHQTTPAGLMADVTAAAREIRSDGDRPISALFTIGFCFGGRLAFTTPAMGLDLAGAIGFYGRPTPRDASDTAAPITRVDRMHGSVLGLFGGADPGIPAESIQAFDAALTVAGIDHRLVTYPDAPHSFFDRKAADFADESAAAWSEVLEFVRGRTS